MYIRLSTSEKRIELWAAMLEDKLRNVCNYFNTICIEPIPVKIHLSRQEYQRANGTFDGPIWWVGHSPKMDSIEMASPFSPDINKSPEEMGRVLVHEFVHCVTKMAIPGIGAGGYKNWVIEGIAMYLAGQKIASRPTGNIIQFSKIEEDGNYYRYGHITFNFIEDEYGKSAAMKILESNGDIEKSVGVSFNEFESKWKEYIMTIDIARLRY